MVVITGIKEGLGMKIKKKLTASSAYGNRRYGAFHYGAGAKTHGIYRVRHRWGKTVQEKLPFYVPDNPQSISQLAWREAFSEAVAGWQALTPEQQAVYNKKARYENYSGYNLYIKENIIMTISRVRTEQNTSNQWIGTSSSAKILFDTEAFDEKGEFANSRFTPKTPGYYFVQANITLKALADGNVWQGRLHKNAVWVSIDYHYSAGPGAWPTAKMSTIIYLNGSTDYIEVWGYHTHGSTRQLDNSAGATVFSAHKLS